ncbi:MAG: response regulator [Solirubrobacteraceae bacterium]
MLPRAAFKSGSRDADLSSSVQIKVLIADDHPLIIAGLRRTVEHLDDIALVGEARTAAELLELVQRRRPDIVLMDLRMPGMTGVEAIRRIRHERPEVKIVVLSACDETATIEDVLAAGASGYVLKSAHALDVASVIRQAAAGMVLHPHAAAAPVTTSPVAVVDSGLTGRERSILEAVATGMTTAAISRELWISEHTIKFHLTNIYRKIGVPNRAGAIRYALEHDIA